VYWSDGSVLSDDPAHFAIVSNQDHYLFTKDSRAVRVNGNPIAGADPATFRVLNADFECSADQLRAYYRQTVVANADPGTFPPDRAVTYCDETSIRFAD
jgi:DKNYY family